MNRQDMLNQVSIRADYQKILDFIKPGSNVLDLGCGNGELLYYLQQQKGAKIHGVELSIDGVNACIEKGIDVFHGDIIDGLKDYAGDSFDYVILSQTLHELPNPDKFIMEMLRVGKQILVSFFNLAFYQYRLSFMAKGRFPKSFPYSWKNTYASIITVKDFKEYCINNHITIAQEIYLNEKGRQIGGFLANWRAQVALIILDKSR